MTAIALGERQRSLQPLRAALIANAQAKAQAIRAGAEADGREVLAAAKAEADAVLATARAQGTADVEAALSLERAHDARAARGLLLAAQQRAYDKLRQQARDAVRSLLRDPARRSQLADTLRHRVGAGATVNDHPDGGLLATGPNGRGADASVHALVDVALAQLNLETLWAST
jgi:vacuolar-type H+-ATPase subunit E/Vma4